MRFSERVRIILTRRPTFGVSAVAWRQRRPTHVEWRVKIKVFQSDKANLEFGLASELRFRRPTRANRRNGNQVFDSTPRRSSRSQWREDLYRYYCSRNVLVVRSGVGVGRDEKRDAPRAPWWRSRGLDGAAVAGERVERAAAHSRRVAVHRGQGHVPAGRGRCVPGWPRAPAGHAVIKKWK